MAAPIKPGYATTEFWVTLLTTASGIASVLDPALHVQGYIKVVAVVAAGVSSIVYTASRSGLKAAAREAVQDVEKVAERASVA